MGLLDNAVPGGSISKPLILALLALVASGALFGGGDQAPAPTKPGGPRPSADEGGGGLLEGLGGLLDRFRQSGQGKTADSWVRPRGPEHHQDDGRTVRHVGGGTPQTAVAGSAGYSR